MHAAIVHLAFDKDQVAEGLTTFHDKLVPQVSRSVGFKQGWWIDPIDNRGMGFLLFDSETSASTAMAAVQWKGPGVRLVHIVISLVEAQFPPVA